MHELSLPRSQHVQQRLRDEALELPDARIDELPYMDAVVKEGLRLFAPIPMSLPRYVPPDGRTIGGYALPAGSIVSCQAYSVHRLNQDVFPSPEDFWPERWLDKIGAVEKNRFFFAFAAGGRGCIGRKYVSQLSASCSAAKRAYSGANALQSGHCGNEDPPARDIQ